MYVYWSLDSKLHSSLCSCSCSDSQIQTIPKEAQRFYKRQGTCTWNYWSVTSPAMSRWPDMPMKMSLLTSVFFFFWCRISLLCSAKEWLGHNTAPRQVTLAFNEKKVFQTFDENGSPLSSYSLGSQEHLNVIISNDHQHRALLLKIPKEYDLVRIW